MFLNFVIAVLMWFACVADLGWTAWTDLRIAPAFLDLAVVVVCLFSRPQWIVFWGGVAGLLSSVVHVEPIPLCVVLFTSVTLIAAWTKPSEMKRQTFAATLIRCLLVLIVLKVGRIGIAHFPDTNFLGTIGMEQIAQVALTFLISITVCMLFMFLHRRHAWE
ncbi:hypothetical protein [Thalassoglobus polymorphus]|uniref:Uncharacterized protein n=1 Tax=Thalassoglobus polymorphus TaxID=2527994 RepID=A0A517QIZ1_9PLAN|nr:hypothetical protein [Thalassoglobus polymorphus]QDT31623.1 hypothetical protein Mal48_08580 [Thalassoglobus polymorphus]